MNKREKGALTLSWIVALAFGVTQNANAMHIMEGYLPMGHCVAWGALCLPFVVYGVIRIQRIARDHRKTLLLLAMCGAYAFVLSALKIPSVTGSSSHPTGTGLGAILFGPAVMAVLGLIVLLWNSQENRTPMSKTLSGKRVIGEASSFDQWREIQFIGSVAPAAVVVGLDPAEYDLANLIPLHGGAVEPVDQFLLQRCEKTLHARVVKAAMRAAHALPDGTEPGEHRPVLLAGVLAAVVGVQYQPLLITIA